MPLYDFRLRFNFPEAYRIDSDVEEIELLVSTRGERIRLRSGAIGTPIKDHNHAAVLGGPFASEDQARAAAEKSKRALLCWAIEQRLGIDFGDRKQRSMATNAYLAMLEKQHGHPFRNDIHGIDVYKHVEKLKFVSVNAKATVGKYPPRLIDTFQREYLGSRQLTEKEVLASEIYASSFFDVSARSRFITLVTAVEALLEKRESITQAGRTLVGRLIPNELFDGQSSADFFTRCYKLRGQILHRGKVEDGLVDILHLANAMESFVARLLLAALNSAPQQGTGADDGN